MTEESTGKVVMCVSTWPEENEDFEVFEVRPGESDQEAIRRAEEAYSPKEQFYIVAR